METINNYLENMFSAFPQTAEVLKMKHDLLMTMEDKYQELKSLGKSENEAIGIVISEFGNIEELTAGLGINLQTKQENQRPLLTTEDATAYLDANKVNAKKTALGACLCVFGACVLILNLFFFNYSPVGIAIGLGCLLTLVGIAVGFFISQEARMAAFSHFKEQEYVLVETTKTFVQTQKQAFSQSHTMLTTMGVLLCVFSSLFVILPALLFPGYILLGVAVLLFIVALAVYPLVFTDIVNDGYTNLLSQIEIKSIKRTNKIIEVIASVWWPLVVCVYLLWSFIGNAWSISWIIWPIAGIAFGAIAALVSAISKENPEQM